MNLRNDVPRRHVHRQSSSAPPCVDRKSSQTFTVFVTVPSGTMCSIRDVPRPGTVEWIKFQLELQTGIDAQMFHLHYPDGSKLSCDNPLTPPCPQTALILKLHLIERFQEVFRAINTNDWNELKKNLEESDQITNFIEKDEESNTSPHDLTFSSLYLASNIGLENLCRRIIETYPDIINKTTALGHSAVHAAVCNDQSSIVELLLEQGADPTIPDMLGRTSLQIALNKGAKQSVNILRFFKFQPRLKVPTTTDYANDTENGSATVTFGDAGESRSKLEHSYNGTVRRMSSLGMVQKARVKFRDSIISKYSPEGSFIEEPITHESPQGSSVGSTYGKAYFYNTTREFSLDEHRKNSVNSDHRTAEGSPFRPLIHNRPKSAMCGNLPKMVEFVVANRQEMLWDLQGPSSTPRSTSSSAGKEDLSSEERGSSSPDSRVSTPSYRPRAWSAGSYASGSTRRSSQKPAPRAKWLSVKRKLRLAYIFKKALDTKNGQNDAAYKQWIDRKEKEMQTQKRNRLKEIKSDNTEVNEWAFDKWLHAKNTQKTNDCVFRGAYKSAFLIGSTLGGEPKYPDVMENKDSYKKWLHTDRSPHVDIPVNVSSGDFIKSESYKKMETQRQKMLTSAVTYEEWLDAKYVQAQFYKELEALKIREKQQEVTKSLASKKSFQNAGYDKWTRRCQSKQRKVHFSSGDKNSIKPTEVPNYGYRRSILPD